MTDPRRLERETRRLEYELGVATKQLPFLRALVEGTSDLLALVDCDGVILEYNRAFAEALEATLPPSNDRTKTIFSLFHGQEGDEHPLLGPADLEAALLSATRLYGQIANSRREVEVVLSPTMALTTPLVILSARPLDEAGLRRRELHAAERRVEELKHNLLQQRSRERDARHEALSVLAGTLAHDLNNSLSVVFGSLELLHEAMKDHPALDLLEHIFDGLTATGELANRLGTFSKGATVILRSFHLQPWLTVMLKVLENSQPTTIRFFAPEDEAWIDADEAQLTQVLVNLITNAFQAAVGPPEIEVHLRADVADDAPDGAKTWWRIDILDRGPGIPTAMLERVFEPFVTTKPSGSGLGLASCASIIKAHRGSIRASHREGGGLIVSIKLPQNEGVAARTPAPQAARRSHEFGTIKKDEALSGVDVLIMDDDPLVLQTVERILMASGARTYTAAEGEAAIEIHARLSAKGVRPIFLCDLNVKAGLDGVSTVRRLLDRDPGVIAIACSGYSVKQVATTHQSFGFHAYLAKPFTASELVETVLKVCPASPDE